MLLVLHVVVAIVSLCYSTFVAFSPSKRKLHFLYGSMAATVLSGIIVVFDREVNFGRVCLSGVVYMTYATISTFIARHKLASLSSRT